MKQKIHLYMEAQTLNDSLSHNVMGEITGQIPHEVIVVGVRLMIFI